jgi:hypothetical protein
VVGGEAVAFPFAELARAPLAHAAVAGRSLLIVYIERAATAVAFSRAIGGRTLAFHRLAADGAGWRMQDRETGSLWNAVTGEALGGPLEGSGLQAAGIDLSSTPFWAGEFQRVALAAPVFADVTSIMDLGLVLGAGLAAGLAGRFGSARRPAPRLLAAGLIGGLLLGYGARIAYGCNIGAMFSGIASTSLHGWLWGAAALLGTPVGVRLRRLVRPD